MTEQKSMGVWAALKQAQESIEAVGKGSQNQFHGYNYTSAEDMLKACRKALHDSGLVAYRLSWKIITTEAGVMVLSHFCIALASDEDESVSAHVEYPAIPGNGRPLDKAISAALTTSFSYWLRDMLMLPRVDGLEVDTRDDSGYKHDEQEAVGLAIEIEDRATPEQMEKLMGQLGKYKATKLEEVPLVTLKAWLKRVKEVSK